MNTGIRIIGLGNPLMGDDGVGAAVVESLVFLGLPVGVAAVDGGTPGFALLDLMAGAAKVVLIDAVQMGKRPGAVARFTPEEVRMGAAGVGGAHGGGIAVVLSLGEEMGLLPPEIVIFGIEPATVEPRLGLSPPVAAALEEVVRGVLAEVNSGC